MIETAARPAIAAPTLQQWLDRVDTRESHIGIIGLGYVGLPLALLFSAQRFRVTGLDIDASKVDTLNNGRSYIQRVEPGHIAAARSAGFAATTDFAALTHCDAILICVPTPLRSESPSERSDEDTSHTAGARPTSHEPDMSFIQGTLESLAPHTRPGQLIILESTTWPGTTEEIVIPTLERLGPPGTRVARNESALSTPYSLLSTPSPSTPYPLPPTLSLLVAFSPEREDPGNLITPRHAVPKVIGGVDTQATTAASALYATIFDQTVQMSSPAAAEMTKLLENIYRNVNIALVNEVKQLCIAMNIDIWEVIEAAATKPFGFQPFYPGPGIGGHCIPVDPFYLTWRAKQFQQPMPFIELAGQINEAMPAYIVQTVQNALTSLHCKKILILGVSYKRDIDDLRESPALTIIDLLQRAGADVAYNDPFFPEVGCGRHYSLKMHSTPLDRVPDFDAVLLITDHSTYEIADLVQASKLFIDTRNTTRGLTSPNIIRC
jgi:UDP-N-acetyl-D-glucosamine dehydrogenase